MRIEISPADRVAIVGATGSGKTVLAEWLTRRTKRLVVTDGKGTLEGRWNLQEWTRKTRKLLLDGDPVRIRALPPIVDRSKPIDWEPILWDVYDAGDVLLYNDETSAVAPPGRRSLALHAIYTRGRELGIGAISSAQRPVSIPLELLSESSWFFCFRLMMLEDRQRMAALMGPNVLEGVRHPYGFWTYHVSWPEAVYTPILELPARRERSA